MTTRIDIRVAQVASGRSGGIVRRQEMLKVSTLLMKATGERHEQRILDMWRAELENRRRACHGRPIFSETVFISGAVHSIKGSMGTALILGLGAGLLLAWTSSLSDLSVAGITLGIVNGWLAVLLVRSAAGGVIATDEAAD